MKYKFIIIAILIFIKVIGVASHARADEQVYTKEYLKKHYQTYLKSDFYKQEQKERQKQWEEKVEEMQLKREWLEDTKAITNIELNLMKNYCIRNDFETLDCVDYSLVSSSIINHESNKITNGKISKDEESEMKEKEELILSMTLSTLFNITQL